MAPGKPNVKNDDPAALAREDAEIAGLAKRHRVTQAVVREIVRRLGSHERAAVAREIGKGKARR